MEGYCTCGAKLVEDALFCHRCGRPLRELVPPDSAEAPAAAAPPETVRQPEPASPFEPGAARPAFQNDAAMRAGFLAAILVQLASMLSAAAGASLLLPLVLVGGGFYSVVLYGRRTGLPPTVLEGARVGWITGIFTFVIMTVFFAAGMVLLMRNGEMVQAYQESLAAMNLPGDAVDRLRKLLADPKAFSLTILAGLVFQFVFLTIFCSLGGALGARLRGRRA